MSIPESQNIIIRWLQTTALNPSVPITPTERRAILEAINLLKAAQAAGNPYLFPSTLQDLQSRVTPLNSYITQQLLPLIDPSRRPPSPPQPDGSSLRPLWPLPQHEIMLLLLNSLSELLRMPQPKEKPERDIRPEKRVENKHQRHVPVPQGPKYVPGHVPENTHPAAKPAAKIADPSGVLAQLTKRAAQLLSGNASDLTASLKANPAAMASTPAVNLEEWIFRLMEIQAAASMMTSGADKSSTASSTQMAVAMSRLFTQFAKLQTLIGETGNPALIPILETAKARIQDYLTQMTALLKTQNPTPLTSQQLEGAMQRSLQEEGWLSSLIGHVESQTGQKSSAKTENPTFNPAAVLTAKSPTYVLKETMDAQVAAAIRGETALHANQQQLLQPRSAPELFAMIQAHLVKHPFTPINILIPYPMSLQLDDPVADVSGTEKQRNDAKKPSGQKIGQFGGASAQVMCLIPAGPVIIGDPFKEGREDEQPCRTEQLDPFLLAATPVTNAQFASWLNEQFEKKTIVMTKPGHIYDQQGRLLAHTFEAAPLSQIEIAIEHGDIYFRAQRFFENHPVVHVSFWGAKAFCETQGLILPNLAEWERAAGMLPTVRGKPIEKQRYGCGTQELSLAWANYQTHGKPPKENRTLPVGFFDGTRVLTLAGQRIETKKAASPWGCYDMSGNIREWVDQPYDDDGIFRITKGGSYADRPFDLRVASRLPLPSDSTDPYTGFRTAIRLPSEF